MGALQWERHNTLSTTVHNRCSINGPWQLGFPEVLERTYGNTGWAGRSERSGRAAETLMRHTETAGTSIHLWGQFDAGGKVNTPVQLGSEVTLPLAMSLSDWFRGQGISDVEVGCLKRALGEAGGLYSRRHPFLHRYPGVLASRGLPSLLTHRGVRSDRLDQGDPKTIRKQVGAHAHTHARTRTRTRTHTHRTQRDQTKDQNRNNKA